MRDKSFYLNAIKMDLLRVVTLVGKLENEISEETVLEFIKHAENDLGKIKLDKNQIKLKKLLSGLKRKVSTLSDPHKRLRWAEDVLTIRSRL